MNLKNLTMFSLKSSLRNKTSLKPVGHVEVFYDTEHVDLNLDHESVDGEDLEMELPPTLLVPFAVVLACLLMVGVIGNVLVISVLVRARLKERSRGLMPTSTTTNAYILNLSAADLLFLVFCAPFQGTVYILNHWPYGWFICKAAHYCQFCTVYASIWVLTMMSVDRYVAIGHPLKSVKWRHPRQAMRISAGIWLTAGLLSLPWLILYESYEVETTSDGNVRMACYDEWSDATYEYRKWMILFVFLIGFLIPSCIIFCMAVLVAKSIKMATHQPLLTVNSSGQSSGKELVPPQSNRQKISIGGADWGGTAVGVRLRRRRRVGWLVFALAFLFFACWMPHNLSMIWLNFDSKSLDWVKHNHQTFFILKLLAHMMTYMNSCINPVLYSLASNHFRGRLLAYSCHRGRASNTTFNSSCRPDTRTCVQPTPAASVWLRHPSTCGLGTAAQSPASIRKASMMSSRKPSNLSVNQRQQKISLTARPVQKASLASTVSSVRTSKEPVTRVLSVTPQSIRSMGSKRDPSKLHVPFANASPRLVTTPILDAVHMISKKLEVARKAQRRRSSLQQERITQYSFASLDEDSDGNHSVRRCSR